MRKPYSYNDLFKTITVLLLYNNILKAIVFPIHLMNPTDINSRLLKKKKSLFGFKNPIFLEAARQMS
jgi:hypothetical protein